MYKDTLIDFITISLGLSAISLRLSGASSMNNNNMDGNNRNSNGSNKSSIHQQQQQQQQATNIKRKISKLLPLIQIESISSSCNFYKVDGERVYMVYTGSILLHCKEYTATPIQYQEYLQQQAYLTRIFGSRRLDTEEREKDKEKEKEWRSIHTDANNLTTITMQNTAHSNSNNNSNNNKNKNENKVLLQNINKNKLEVGDVRKVQLGKYGVIYGNEGSV